MRQTANYQLPLWDAADRILREDFNRSNEKIAAALNGKWAAQLLLDVTITAQANRVDVDVRGIHFERYAFIFLDTALLGHAYLGVFVNGEGRCPTTNIGMAESKPGVGFQLLFFPLKNGKAQACCLGVGNYIGLGGAAVRYEDIHTLSLQGANENYHAAAGSRIVMWGVK